MTAQTETMIFNTKRDCQKVNRALRNSSILSRVAGRELTAYVPTDMTGDQLRDLMRKLVYQ